MIFRKMILPSLVGVGGLWVPVVMMPAEITYIKSTYVMVKVIGIFIIYNDVLFAYTSFHRTSPRSSMKS